VSIGIHPVADIFPRMSAAEFAALVGSIAENGLREPIWLHADGRIIDGRNRYAACEHSGTAPTFRTYEGDDEGLVKFVLDLNLHRRHLNESQRAYVAAQLATLKDGQRKDLAERRAEGDSIESPLLPAVSRKQAAEMLNVGRESVARAAQVRDFGSPEMQADVEAGELPVSRAASIIREAEKDPERVAEVYAEVKARPHVVNNSGENEWYTPPEFIAAARGAMGSIDLDPATSATANENVGAPAFFTAEDDGLGKEWHGNVWMNPPYSDGLMPKFADKLADEFEAGRVRQAVVLVNNATETGWAHVLAEAASAVCHLRGRIRFWYPGRPSKTPLQGQVVFYLGDNADSFADAFAPLGRVWKDN
jgi:phage N-6-adenine-methyltransferase